MSSSSNTEDGTQLLNSAKHLNSVLLIGNQSDLNNKINENQNNLALQKTILEDLQDAITTHNRNLIEQEKVVKKPRTILSNLQDWSLFVFFAGYGLFALFILIYIFRMPSEKKPFILAIVYLFLTLILYISFVFIIQRFG